MARNSGAAAAHAAGTDNRPIEVALGQDPPATGEAGFVITGKDVGGARRIAGPGLYARPATDDVVGVDTGVVAADVVGKGRGPQG